MWNAVVRRTYRWPKIRVKNGRSLFGVDIATALRKAQPGDTLLLSEGQYVVDSTWLQNLHILGDGDPQNIVVQGQLELRGHCSLQNLTVQAAHFHNAITIETPHSHATLRNTYVVAEPGQKYPALHAANATLNIHQTSFVQQPDLDAIALQDTVLEAQHSYLGTINASGSTVVLTDCGAETLLLYNRSKVTAHGHLACTPPEGRRSLVLSNESVAILEYLSDTAPAPEAFCDDSFLEISRLTTPNAPHYAIVTKANATVQVPDDGVTIRDEDAPLPAITAHGDYGPNAIVWDLADAHAYEEVIAPQLVGNVNTVLFEEGEYFLGEGDTASRLLNGKLMGLGRAEHTIVYGTIGPMADGHLEVENLTVKSVGDQCALTVPHAATASLTNVHLATDSTAANMELVRLDAGETTMVNCTLEASPQLPSARGFTVRSKAKLDAQNSSLGWCSAADDANVMLQDCRVLDLWAFDRAEITTQGCIAILPSDTQNAVLGVETGATVRLAQVMDRTTTHIAYVAADATLEISTVETSDGQSLVLNRRDSSRVFVDSPNVVIQNHPQVEPQSVHVPAPAQGSPTESDLAQPVQSSPAAQPTSSSADPLADIMALTGLEKVKAQITAFVKMVAFNQKRAELGLRTTQQTLHSLFLGNPGTGKTTVARLLADALYAAGAIRTATFREVSRKDLVGTTLGASANMTRAVLEETRGGVLFIDEAYSLYQENNNEFAKEAVEELLAFMENHRDDIAIIFAGYTSEMLDFLAMNPGLKSRIPQQFDFEDYTPDGIASIGYRSLLADDYLVNEDLYRRTVAQRYQQSVDKSNGRWVRNFNQQLISVMADRVANAMVQDPNADLDVQTIRDQDIYDLVGGDVEAKEQKVAHLLDQLDDLIGLTTVKTWVRELITEVQANEQLQKMSASFDKPTYHMVFAGNPGTGKTTVARIIAQLFYNLGLLETDTVKTVDRTDLVGKYYGHTEANTKKIIDEALGGVLFVDEAYQLSAQSNGQDFGQQAIETFMTRLEDDRDTFVAIFAGYTQQMQQFLNANPGLRSRIPLTIEFPDYSPEEIGRMVVTRLQKTWSVDAELLAHIAAVAYQQVPIAERANARWARTFGDRLISAQKQWIVEQNITTEKALVIDSTVLVRFAADLGVEIPDQAVMPETP